MKKLVRSHLSLETKKRGSSKARIKRMLQSRRREKKSHIQIVQKKSMMKTNVVNFILK